MIKVIIVDDEPLARTIVEEYLNNYKNVKIIAQCNNGFEGVKAINEYQPDLVFLDIQMPKINGFEMLELIDKKPAVIFTTAFDEYAIKAFEQNAIDYLLKPFDEKRFEKALKKFFETQSSNKLIEKSIDSLLTTENKHADEAHRIVVKNGSNIMILPIADVPYIEAYDDYVKIFNKETFFLKKKTMAYYENVLAPSQFVRIHRSFILNINYLTKIEPIDKNNSQAVLISGQKLPLSKSGVAKLKEVLNL